jgi:hypothetical protein
MKRIITFLLTILCLTTIAQTDREMLSLEISKADAANLEKLKQFIWKRASVVTVDGEEKMHTYSEFSWNTDGDLEFRNIDAEATVKHKPGIRGRIQDNVAEDKLDYVEKALELSLKYAFMTKGQLLDFFGKADINETEDMINATANDVLVKGDSFTVKVEKATNLFVQKKFTTLMGDDPISGELNYGKFSSGISHGTTSILNLPAKKAVITSENKDYTMRVQ